MMGSFSDRRLRWRAAAAAATIGASLESVVLLASGLAVETACGNSSHTTGSPAGSDSGAADSAVVTDTGAPGSDSGIDSPARASDAAADADAGPSSPPGGPCLPFAMPSAATLFGSSKRVFAHYFYPFPLSIGNVPADVDYYEKNYLSPGGENGKWLAQGGFLRQRPLPVEAGAAGTYLVDDMEREVRMAIAAGITGFTVDVLDPTEASAGSQLQNLYTAATAVDSRFKIVVMPDISALGANQASVESIIESVANNLASYRLADGRLVVSAFDASLGAVSFWQTILGDLAGAGIQIAFVPTFLGWEGNAAAFAPISYGFADWGTATPGASASSQAWPASAHGYGRIFMMPVDPQQYRPKDFAFWEAGNSAAFRAAWTSAIAGGSDWVQLVTWSDFSESSQVEPYTDETLAGDIGNGFYDLDAYYASWFLTGQQPTITHDVLYWFYRREPTTAAASAQGQVTTIAANGTPENDIELLAFLTAPGTLTITVDGQTTTQDAPAGVTSLKAPLLPGIPRFGLSRAGVQVVSFPGGVQVYGDGGLDSGTLDLTYWSGSASPAGTCQLSVP
jgi:hypothetical protein